MQRIHTGAHSSRGTDTTCDHLLQLVDVGSTTPLLVLDNVDFLVHLGLLDKLAIGTHADGAILRGNLLLLWPDSVDTLSELFGLSEIGQLGLHPNGVAVRCIGDSAVHCAVTSTLEAEVTLTRSGSIPIKEDIPAEKLASNSPGLKVTLSLCPGSVFLLDASLIREGTRVNGSSDSIVETAEIGLGKPLVLNTLQLSTRLASSFSGDHQIVEGLECRVRGAEDKSMVAGVNVGGKECGSLGVSTGNSEKVRAFHIWRNLGEFKLTHDVSLRSDCNEAVDMFLNGDKDFTGHMAALLCAGGLVFNVNSGRTLFNEELGELHDSGETAMTSICVCDNGAEIINVEEVGALLLRDAETLLTLLSIVEKLGHEEMANLVRDGSLGAC
ncbi:hypothetical protein HG531_008172 [Fusarium graminearum]|nr:hypothetical protein HG531_008172 [Fusarium graminearum]